MKVRDLRKSFIEYFASKDHKIVPSSSLIPGDDPTLLFTTAGMVQFKPMFAGTVDLTYTRAASIQKCLRTSDLDNVGRTKRHLTFFEMLGNFSFGDYFKKESIEFAWDYSINSIGFPTDQIWVSIYEEDDEAFDIWKKSIGIPENKIIRLGKKDNFWGPAGDSGACGPCSELYIDRGAEYGCGKITCKPGCECERFLEYWNLVFNQYNQDVNGVLTPLPRTGIDTGMGLERLATLVQKVDSVYETDEFKSIVSFVCHESNIKYNESTSVPVHIISEHARTLTFAMTDGVYPSNDGRGYVLRRILRRALRFSRQLGIHEPFIYKVVDPIVDLMSEFYPEIKASRDSVKKVIISEEKRFLETIENGMDRLEEIMKSLKKKKENQISGEDVFQLYDTFGFPVEMTGEIAAENGLGIDLQGYENQMQFQRERGKQSWKAEKKGSSEVIESNIKQIKDTIFTGYEKVHGQGIIQFIIKNNEQSAKIIEGDEAIIILSKTPFYGESGGQVGDSGSITTDKGAVFTVDDTRKINKSILHIGRVSSGEFNKDDKVLASIDIVRRNLIRANHTGTHLLNAGLRSVLGDHIKQAGSYVGADRLRFDFTHFAALSEEELNRVEMFVNEKIWENIPVTTSICDLDEAVKSGATAVFDEKYEDVVRVVEVPGVSKELCGGTHVTFTGQIGLFKIQRESSPGAGLRRIEALTLKGLFLRYNYNESILNSLLSEMNATEDTLLKKIKDSFAKMKEIEKELARVKQESFVSKISSIDDSAINVNGIKIITKYMPDFGIDDLKGLSDSLREREKNIVVLLGSGTGKSCQLVFAASGDAIAKGIDCGKMIKEVAPIIDGRGGGRKEFAQAGGTRADNVNEALNEALIKARAIFE